MITSDSQFGENKQLPWTTNDEWMMSEVNQEKRPINDLLM